jgi:protein required for attachment to host cells
MKPLRTWALIADSAHARIFENHGPAYGDPHHGTPGHHDPETSWMAIEGLVFESRHTPADRLRKDHRGSRMGLHEKAQLSFAHSLADVLATQLQAGAFHRLIIAAPPSTLGALRDAISERVRATVIAEFAHDLTKIPDHEIAGHLMPIPV